MLIPGTVNSSGTAFLHFCFLNHVEKLVSFILKHTFEAQANQFQLLTISDLINSFTSNLSLLQYPAKMS